MFALNRLERRKRQKRRFQTRYFLIQF